MKKIIFILQIAILIFSLNACEPATYIYVVRPDNNYNICDGSKKVEYIVTTHYRTGREDKYLDKGEKVFYGVMDLPLAGPNPYLEWIQFTIYCNYYHYNSTPTIITPKIKKVDLVKDGNNYYYILQK